MIKKFSGVCSEYNTNVVGWIDYVDSSTNEGREYSKRSMECDHKEIHKCTRNNCPFWNSALEVIRN